MFDDLMPQKRAGMFDDLIAAAPKIDPKAAGQQAVDDMTNNMSFGDKLIAGAGRGFYNLGLGAKQLVEAPAQMLLNAFGNDDGVAQLAQQAQQTQKTVDQARIDDRALLHTGGGATGNIAANFVAGLPAMAVAGPSLAGAAAMGTGMGALETTSGDESRLQNATMGGALGFATQGVINKGGDYIRQKMADMVIKKAQKQPFNDTVNAALDAGFNITRSDLNPGFITNRIEGLAGKSAMEQEFSNANSGLFDALSRRAVGLPEDATLTTQNMRNIRQQAYQDGYDPVAKLGTIGTDAQFSKELSDIVATQQGAARSFPGAFNDDVMKAMTPLNVKYFDASDALNATQTLRNNAKQAFTLNNDALGIAQKKAATAIEDQIERHLNSVGPQGGADLLDNFRAARELMAKTHTVEDAIIEGSGSVDPARYARELQQGMPLTGDLKTMADFANNFAKLSKPDNKTRGAGVSKLDGAFGMGLGAVVGALTTGGLGLATTIGSIAGPPLLRKALLSKTLQRRATAPNYDPTAMQQVLSSKELQMGAAPGANALREYMDAR